MTPRAVIRVSVATRNPFTGKEEVLERDAARANEHFCVLNLPPGCWSVTHIPTGWRACQARTEKKAFAAADALVRIKGVDWAKLTPMSAAAIADPDRMKVRAILKRYCFPREDGAPS